MVSKIQLTLGAVIVVIIWNLDLQLPMQSVPITTNVVSLNPSHDEVYSIQLHVIKVSVNCGRSWFSMGTPVSSINKNDRHNIAEIWYEWFDHCGLFFILR
jgi:hypothetical protein